MEPNEDIQRIIEYCHKHATSDLNNNVAIPFGVVIDAEGELLLVDNHKDLPEANRLSPQNIIETLTQHFEVRLKECTISSYGITYYGNAQINNQGDQSAAFVMNIVKKDFEELPIYIFPYSWSKDKEQILGQHYRMRKKEGQFYANTK